MNCCRGHIPITEPSAGSQGLHHGLEEVDALGILLQGHDGLLILGSITGMHALAAITAAHVDGVDLLNLHAEQSLDSLSDLDLAGIGSNLEGVLLAGDTLHRVLGNDRGQDDVLCSFH